MNIFEFEEKYKDILENIEEWGYLRLKVAFILKNKNNLNVHKNKNYKLFNYLSKIKNLFFGFSNWFYKYDYIFFSDSSERKIINNRYFDKISDDIIDKLKTNVLLIENPTPNHFKNTYTKRVVSLTILEMFSFIIRKFVILAYDKKLEKLLLNNNINIDLKKEIKYFKSKYLIYKLLFKIYKPNAIFINCAYCNPSLIKAANDLKINTIELQHGVISKVHFGYISSLNLNKTYFPKKLLSFGEQERKLENLLIEDVIPIGSFYLTYILKNNIKNNELKNIKKDYKVSIGISMQDQDWERELIFDFILKYNKKYKDTLFILIPRKRKDFPSFSKNVIVYDKLDCYNIILHCDIHMTLYSSCALEAPTLGIPNILVNKKNYAKNYYGDILDDFHTRFVNGIEEFRKYINDLLILKKENIQIKNKDVFVPEYEKNILKFIEDLKQYDK